MERVLWAFNELWSKGIVPFFQNWPVNGVEIGIIWMVVGAGGYILCSFYYLLLVLPFISRTAKESLPEVPESAAAWTVKKSSLWVRAHHYLWGMYPRDVCGYFWRSVIMSVFAILCAVTVLGWILPISSLISSLVYYFLVGIGIGIAALPGAVAKMPQVVAKLFLGLFTKTADGVNFVVSLPATPKIIGGLTLLVLLVLFLNSRSGKLTRLYLKARKERYCPRIRVV